MNNYICTNYEDRYTALKIAITQKRNICLYGSGNNGKTFMTDKVLSDFPAHQTQNIIRMDYFPEQYDPTKLYIVEVNANNVTNTGDLVLIEFMGQYDATTNSYQAAP
jgi:hypothetical protein